MAISDGVLLVEDAAAGYPCLGNRRNSLLRDD